jgi:hypothetical protein
MEEFRRNRAKAERGVTIGDVAYVIVHSENFGEHHDPTFRFFARGLSKPSEHCCSIIDLDFDVL